jgi:hypothetical protein
MNCTLFYNPAAVAGLLISSPASISSARTEEYSAHSDYTTAVAPCPPP